MEFFSTTPAKALYTRHEPILKVTNLAKSYDETVVLRDINFTVDDIVREGMTQGQIFTIVSVSGGGKTTLLNMICGLTKPNEGTIEIGNPLAPVRKGMVGLVYQNYTFYTWRTVKNVLLKAVSKNAEIKEADREGAIAAIADDFDLTPHLKKFSKEMSGGQRQRVALAEQILIGSDLIMLDEPFSGLDAIMIDKVTKLLVKTSNIHERKTFGIVSHDLSNSIAISDTVFILGKEPEKPGSTVKKTICTADRGLAWDVDVKKRPEFRDTVDEVKSLL